MEQTLIRSPHNMLVLRSLDGTDHPLSDVTLVGREAECQVQLSEGHASRYHAKLTVTGPMQVLVEDLKSTNGTFVNGQRVETPIVASLGDELRFDVSRFRIATAHSGNAFATVFREREPLPQQPARVQPPPAPQTAPQATRTPQAGAGLPAAGAEPEPPMEIPAWAEIPFKPDNRSAAARAQAAAAASHAADTDNNRTVTGTGTPPKALVDDRNSTARAKPKKIARFETDESLPAGATSSLPADELVNLAAKSSRTVRRLESTQGPRLVVLNPPARGMIFPLADAGAVGEWLIGRGDDADIALTDRTVSARHAIVRKTGDRWEIENLNATNGVFVNGKLISRRLIMSGDKLRLGRTEMQFRTDNEPGAPLDRATPEPSSSLTPTVLLGLAGAVFLALFVLILILILQRGA